jgi:hypothetical protein
MVIQTAASVVGVNRVVVKHLSVTALISWRWPPARHLPDELLIFVSHFCKFSRSGPILKGQFVVMKKVKAIFVRLYGVDI